MRDPVLKDADLLVCIALSFAAFGFCFTHYYVTGGLDALRYKQMHCEEVDNDNVLFEGPVRDYGRTDYFTYVLYFNNKPPITVDGHCRETT